ncbi:MAG: hypothetical protein ACJA1C_002211 [Crocinitomicaceae bacterium]|jgi:hypothetical protein
MITKEKAVELAKAYIKRRKRRYNHVEEERVQYKENAIIKHGNEAKNERNIWIVSYDFDIPIEEIDIDFICIDAETGIVLYTLGHHGCVEYMEEEGFDEE